MIMVADRIPSRHGHCGRDDRSQGSAGGQGSGSDQAIIAIIGTRLGDQEINQPGRAGKPPPSALARPTRGTTPSRSRWPTYPGQRHVPPSGTWPTPAD
jgi:hypothetical protein